MERSEQRRIVEALILAAPDPIPAARIADVIPRCKPADVRALVEQLNAEYSEQGRAFEIWEVAGGYQVRTLVEYAPYLQQIQRTRPLRISQAALETLAIVAYRQPVTRAEVEHIRGVDVGAVMRSLLERRLVRIAGHREVPGRPMLYGTTRRFLEVFGLDRIEDLPTLRDLDEIAPASGIPLAVGSDAAGEVSAAGEGAAPAPGSDEVALADAEPAGGTH